LVTVPPHDFTNRDVSEYWQRYQQYPHLKSMLAKIRDFLGGHEINRERLARGLNPANCIWLWGEGKPPVMPTLKEIYGISGALISAVDLLKGIGVYAGLEIIQVDGATGYLDTNYEGKAAAALEVLKERDFVFVHVEAPDETAHQGELGKKIQAIEEFDQRIVQPVLNGLRESGADFRLIIAMDHFTPISTRTHSDQPVPIAVYDSRELAPGCGKAYSESNAAAGGKFLANGEEFMKLILETS
jgi:2,3-bisphosphoglycerate-independent phosphoglycerate mutase